MGRPRSGLNCLCGRLRQGETRSIKIAHRFTLRALRGKVEKAWKDIRKDVRSRDAATRRRFKRFAGGNMRAGPHAHYACTIRASNIRHISVVRLHALRSVDSHASNTRSEAK